MYCVGFSLLLSILLAKFAVADADLQVRWGGRSKKNFFRHFVPHFGLKIRGGPEPPVPTGLGLASHANVLRGSSRGRGIIAWRSPKNVCVGGYWTTSCTQNEAERATWRMRRRFAAVFNTWCSLWVFHAVSPSIFIFSDILNCVCLLADTISRMYSRNGKRGILRGTRKAHGSLVAAGFGSWQG